LPPAGGNWGVSPQAFSKGANRQHRQPASEWDPKPQQTLSPRGRV